MKQKLINGDCIEELKKLPANSIDSIVTDPPYGIGFMGKKWDKFKQEKRTKSQVVNMGSGMAFPKLIELKEFQDWCELWAKECLRVLKPGGHILSFGGTRTYHRMTCAIEDAGFEIRDCIFWCYGSGFPKSHNIGKAIDKKQGNKRKVIRENPNKKGRKSDSKGSFVSDTLLGKGKNTGVYIDKGNSEWEGWGSALKPAVEPVVLGRKPLSEKTIVDNVLKHGTGGINIDDSRVSSGGDYSNRNSYEDRKTISSSFQSGGQMKSDPHSSGRFPANLILECICDEVVEGKAKGSPGHWSKTKTKGYGDFGGGSSSYEGVGVKDDMKTIIHTNPDCPCYILDEQSGESKSNCKEGIVEGKDANIFNDGEKKTTGHKQKIIVGNYSDKGGASRYFKEISLKPEVEPVVLGRKPLSEKTIVENVLKYGTGGLNIDGSRVGNEERTYDLTMTSGNFETTGGGKNKKQDKVTTTGRFPANLIHDGSDEVVDKFPENKATAAGKKGSSGFASGYDGDYEIPYGDSGSAARYFKEIEGDRIFYTAKASKSERNNGLEGFEEAPIKGRDAGQDIRNVPYKQRTTPIKNSHPTVKPVKLMKYLIKLITPPNGTVLDPFMGSGTTGVAAKLEGFNFVGIEKEKDYIKIAEARIKNYKENPKKKTKPKKKKVKKIKSEFWK